MCVWEWSCLDGSFQAGQTWDLTFSLFSTDAELVAENNTNKRWFSGIVCGYN